MIKIVDNVNLKEKEEAEWRKKYAAREERFEPPMWEDFKKNGFNFMGKNGIIGLFLICCLDTVKKDNPNYNKPCIYIYHDLKRKNFGLANKENYEKAVDFARKLFLGEEVPQ